MSEYIRKTKIDTNECPNIYWWPIYSNIRIFEYIRHTLVRWYSSPSWTCNRRPRSSSREAPPCSTPPQVWSTLEAFLDELVDLARCCSRWSSPPSCRLKCFPSQRRRLHPSWWELLQRDNYGEPRRERIETWGRGGGNAQGNPPPSGRYPEVNLFLKRTENAIHSHNLKTWLSHWLILRRRLYRS